MFFCVRGWYCFLLLTSFHSFKTFELYKFIFISCSHVYWCINDWWLRQVWWFQWTRILSFYRRWEKQDKLLPVLILNWSTHTLQKHDKNDHLTLSKKIEDGVDHTIVTYIASQLTSLATRDAGQRRVRPSVGIFRDMSAMQCAGRPMMLSWEHSVYSCTLLFTPTINELSSINPTYAS